MAQYLFPAPQISRSQKALETRPVLSLWTRVHRDIPCTVIRKADGVTWEEFSGPWPHTETPNQTYMFGGRGFNAMGSDQSGFVGCSRLYIGGHQYVIDDTLRTELLNAVTDQAPTGYGSFITTAPGGSVFTGDEIILSGRNSEFGRKVTSG